MTRIAKPSGGFPNAPRLSRWRPAVAAAGMYLLVREYLAWTEHGFAESNAVLALTSAVVLGITVSFTGLLWAVSGFPQSAENRVVTALDTLLNSLRGKTG